MAKDTVISVDIHDRDKALDWLTALSPVLLMAVVYYRWSALLLSVVAVAGYVAVNWLLSRVQWLSLSLPAAAVTGVTIALCLPSTTPLWVAALAGMFAACVALLPGLTSRVWADSRPLLCPALAGFLLVRYVFPAYTTVFTMPALWAADTVAGATPLASLGDGTYAERLTRLLMGVHPGSMGEGCVPVLLLAALYLLIRRRLRLIAPATMLATVALLSLMVWQDPLGGVLSGGVVLAALLLADRTFAPGHYGPQAVAGVVAGILVVLLRALTATDGSAVGVLVACALSPLYPAFLRYSGRFFCWLWALLRRWVPLIARRVWEFLRHWVPIIARWTWEKIAWFAAFVAEKVQSVAKKQK